MSSTWSPVPVATGMPFAAHCAAAAGVATRPKLKGDGTRSGGAGDETGGRADEKACGTGTIGSSLSAPCALAGRGKEENNTPATDRINAHARNERHIAATPAVRALRTTRSLLVSESPATSREEAGGRLFC